MAGKKYLVTSCGVKKATGEPYCWAREIVETPNGTFLSDRNSVDLQEDRRPVGTIVEIETSIVSSAK